MFWSVRSTKPKVYWSVQCYYMRLASRNPSRLHYIRVGHQYITVYPRPSTTYGPLYPKKGKQNVPSTQCQNTRDNKTFSPVTINPIDFRTRVSRSLFIFIFLTTFCVVSKTHQKDTSYSHLGYYNMATLSSTQSNNQR